MSPFLQPNFTEAKYSTEHSWQKTNALPAGMRIERANTQSDVNSTVLNYLVQKFDKQAPLTTIDLPCGGQEFVSYLKQLFPQASITGVDIIAADAKPGIHFLQMDISEPFTISQGEQYDLITSISGVMMFSNTKLFIDNCISRLKKGGTFILTNDNSATLKDKLTFLLFGNLRMFPAVYADNAWLTENVSIQELVRLLRTNGVIIKDIVYTSSNPRDYLIWPFAFFIYPVHRWFLKRFKNTLPPSLIEKMYPFKHYYCRHYIIIGEK